MLRMHLVIFYVELQMPRGTMMLQRYNGSFLPKLEMKVKRERFDEGMKRG
jgi:hypothetical protein